MAPRLRRNTRSTRSREDEEVNETRQIPQQLWIHLQSFVAFRAGSRKKKPTRRLRSTLIEKLDRESKVFPASQIEIEIDEIVTLPSKSTFKAGFIFSCPIVEFQRVRDTASHQLAIHKGSIG